MLDLFFDPSSLSYSNNKLEQNVVTLAGNHFSNNVNSSIPIKPSSLSSTFESNSTTLLNKPVGNNLTTEASQQNNLIFNNGANRLFSADNNPDELNRDIDADKLTGNHENASLIESQQLQLQAGLGDDRFGVARSLTPKANLESKAAIDQFQVPQASDSIRIVSPSTYYVFENKASHRGNILISGTYIGVPGTIQARWRGSGWSDIAENSTEGQFNGVLVNRPEGQGLLEVRFYKDKAIIASQQLTATTDTAKINPQTTSASIQAQIAQASDSLTILSPSAYQVFQRNGANQGNILISGTYTGSPTAIQARWRGSGWSTISYNPSQGRFDGVLANRPEGQGLLEVRFYNDKAVTASKEFVGIGDIFVIAGQSNASGRGRYNQTSTNPKFRPGLFGNDDKWKVLQDPVDSPVGQVDKVSNDSDKAAGSVWPLLADQLMASQNVPIAFIPTAKGGSSIRDWQPNAATTFPLNLYQSMSRRIKAAGSGGVKAVLFWQGETDAKNGTSQSTYQSLLQNFASRIGDDFGVNTIVAQIGDYARVSGSRLDSIRLAQTAAWNNQNRILPGPSLYDVNVSDDGADGVHFIPNNDLALAANRWWSATQASLYNGSDGRGPRLSSITLNSTQTEITLKFFDQTLPLQPASKLGGFTVESHGQLLDISSVTTVTNDTIKIVLRKPAPGPVTISLGKGHSAVGKTVPKDSSIYLLPAEVFVNQ